MIGDEKSVLDHILDCDVERKSLLKELGKYQNSDDTDMNDEEKLAKTVRLA